MSDRTLDDVLPAAQAGQAWALRVLYDTLSPKVHGYLRTRGAADPEDLTSEVFLAVFPRLSTISGGAAGLRTLLFSIAHARLVDDLRRQARRSPTVPFVPEQDRASSPSAEDEALDRLGAQRVQELLAVLPDDQREVLALRIVSDLTSEQTATVMGRSTGAVKQLQRRALLALRAHLSQGSVTV